MGLQKKDWFNVQSDAPKLLTRELQTYKPHSPKE